MPHFLRQTLEVRLNYRAHAAGQIETKLNRAGMHIFKVQYTLSVSGFDAVEHGTLAGNPERMAMASQLLGAGSLRRIGFFADSTTTL